MVLYNLKVTLEGIAIRQAYEYLHIEVCIKGNMDFIDSFSLLSPPNILSKSSCPSETEFGKSIGQIIVISLYG